MFEDSLEQISSSFIELNILKPNNELDVPVELGDVHCNQYWTGRTYMSCPGKDGKDI